MSDNEKKTKAAESLDDAKAAESLDDAALKDVVGGTGNTNPPPEPYPHLIGETLPPPDADPS